MRYDDGTIVPYTTEALAARAEELEKARDILVLQNASIAHHLNQRTFERDQAREDLERFLRDREDV